MAKPLSSRVNNFEYEMVRDKDLHISRYGGWLESRFHFRFADWMPNDRKRHGFGMLYMDY